MADERARELRRMVDESGHAEAVVDDIAMRLARLEDRLLAMERRIERPTGDYSAEMTMAQVLRRHPGARAVLAQEGLPDCSGCAVRFDETLAEAAEAYGFELPQLLARLQALVR